MPIGVAEVVRVFGRPAGEPIGERARRDGVVDRLVVAARRSAHVLGDDDGPGSRGSVGAVLGDALLGEQGSTVKHEPDHADDRHERESGDDQHLASGGRLAMR